MAASANGMEWLRDSLGIHTETVLINKPEQTFVLPSSQRRAFMRDDENN
jgi:hypothetical protein